MSKKVNSQNKEPNLVFPKFFLLGLVNLRN